MSDSVDFNIPVLKLILVDQWEVGGVGGVGFHFGEGYEAERGAVDAVAPASFVSRAVGEYVAEMGVGVGGSYFGAHHAMRCVGGLFYQIGRYRTCECRPAAS